MTNIRKQPSPGVANQYENQYGNQYENPLNVKTKPQITQPHHFWVYIRRTRSQHRTDTLTPMCSAALFTVVKLWN